MSAEAKSLERKLKNMEKKQNRDKEWYREYFNQCKPYLKLNTFCKMCGVNQSSLSKFIKDPLLSYTVSLDSLERLYVVTKGVLIDLV